IVATPWRRALLHPHCPPKGLSHASHASETAWVRIPNIPLHAKICDKTTPIARVIQLPTILPISHLPLWSPSQASAMMTLCGLKRLFRIQTCCLSPPPATASAEGAQLNGRPFPATASAEGAQLNAPPSRRERVRVRGFVQGEQAGGD